MQETILGSAFATLPGTARHYVPKRSEWEASVRCMICLANHAGVTKLISTTPAYISLPILQWRRGWWLLWFRQ